MPYIALVLGVNNYGLIGFAQSIMAYFLLAVDYGFNITATRHVSVHRNDKKELNKTFTATMICKGILVLICFIILCGMTLFIPKMQENPLLYFLYFGIVIGNALFPVWYFQGIEEMSAVGILNFVSKLIFTVGLFIFVKSAHDIYFVAILNSLGYLVMGVISLLLLKVKFKVSFVKIKMIEIKNSLKEGWDFFVTNMAGSTFTTTNIFVLGLLTTDEITGYFNLAFTIIRVCSTIALPIIQTFYPRVSLVYESSKEEAFKFVKKLLFILSGVFLFGCIILLTCSGFILNFIFGDKFQNSIQLIQIMAFLPLFYALENTMGMMIMALEGFQKILARMYLGVALGSIIALIVLTLNFGAIGTAISALLAELSLAIIIFAFLKHRKVFFSRNASPKM